MHTYGFPLCYYIDSLRVFRFVQASDSAWRKHVLQTDDVHTQWRYAIHSLMACSMSSSAMRKLHRLTQTSIIAKI